MTPDEGTCYVIAFSLAFIAGAAFSLAARLLLARRKEKKDDLA